MTTIHADFAALTADNRPTWSRTAAGGFFSLAAEGHRHDRHVHDFIQIYGVVRDRPGHVHSDPALAAGHDVPIRPLSPDFPAR